MSPSESPDPDMSYQAAAGGGAHGGGGTGGEVEWDPEALGHALLTADSAWSAVSNLDAFFTKVYTYYVERGFWCMIATRLTNLLTLAFTICFSTFLLLFIQWNSLLFCSNNEECDDVVGLRQHVFSQPTTGDIVVFIYFGVFCLFWCWNFLSFFYSLKDALEMKAFYRDDLNISDEDLVSLEWHYILDSLVALQVSGRKKLCIVRDLSALDITNRIMRKDNYMIALINLDIFQLGPRSKLGVWNATPQCGGCCGNESRRRQQRTQLKEVQQQHAQLQQQKKTLRERKPQTYNVAFPANNKPLLAGDSSASDTPNLSLHSSRVHDEYQSIGSPSAALPPQSVRASSVGTAGVAAGSLTPRVHSGSLSSWWSWAMLGTTLDWNLRFCVLNSLFDAHFSIHPSYLGASGINALKARFIGMGIINLLLSPFILLFMIIFFFLKHAEEFQSKRTLFGPRQWCNLAQWKIREWNELPHFFERRLVLSSVAAQQYMSQFPNTLVAIIAQSVAYICGAVVAVLLLLTVTDGDVISHRIGDRTLLWYLAMFSAALALSRSMIPDKSIYPAPALVMSEVIKHTHYSPQHWKGLWHTAAVHRELSYMYPSRLSMFAYEIMSVIMTPFVLIFCLPHSAERIVQFVTTRTVNVQGVGHLCSYAMFDIDKYGDQRYAQLQPVDFSPEAVAANATGKDAGGSGSGSKVPSRQHSTSGAPSAAAAPPPFPLRPKQGKMEKSFLSFSMHNPHWKAENDGASASAGGQRFLQSIADSMYGSGRQLDSDRTPPMLSRESSEPRRGRATGSLKAASSSALPPPSIGFTRQDSLDSSTTDENDGEFKPEDDEAKHAEAVGVKSSASEMLSQSDRHALVQSFADLMGLDSSLAAHLNPSTMMRQSSLGASSAQHPVGGASTLGMSTMLGINQRRGGYPQPLSSPQRASSGGGMNQSVLLRSQLGSNSFNPSNSVLLNNSMLRSTSGGGGLQGGLSASSMLRLDPQAMREQLMLAQADQQADLFALLESRLDEAPAVVDEGEEGAEQEDDSSDEEERAAHQRSHISQAPPAFLAATYAQPAQQQRSQPAAPLSTSPPRVSSSTETARSGLSPQPLHRRVSDDNEPPPMSFIAQ